ncbi:MAG: zinc ribbon domain-containing protein [Clostridia bacterium]|nr:zinc ribbon domain-containing protein [Clostridia bacterium]
MFCGNCGKQLDENAKFCDECGAQQGVSAQINDNPNNVYSNTDAQKKETKPTTKKSSAMSVRILIVVIALIAGSLVGKFVIAPSYANDEPEKNNLGGQTITSQSNVSNPAYDAILEGANIVRMPPFFNMDTMSFAQKNVDGTIYCGDYGYEGDLVKRIYSTVYVPIQNLTDTEKSLLESSAKAELAKYEALDFCTVNYNMSLNYFSYTIEFKNIDLAQNYSKLYSVGFLENNAPISMSETEKRMIDGGSVKK